MLNPDFRDMLSAFIAEKVDFLVVGARLTDELLKFVRHVAVYR